MSTSTPQRSKLQRDARIFRVLAAVAVTVSLLSIGAQMVSVAAPVWKGGPVTETLLRVSQQLVLSAPAVFYVYGLIRARHIFRRMGKGELFVRANSDGLRAVGISLLVGAVWAMVVAGLDSHIEYHDHELHNIGFAAADIALAALGLALIMIGRVMNAAINLKADNDGFI